MDLIRLQRAQARLFTDAETRERFLADPIVVGREMELAEAEAAALAADQRLNRFADSLISKRRGEVAKILPSTRAALGTRFGEVFRRFAATRPLSGEPRHLIDAIDFASDLPVLGVEPHWCDLARWEAADALVRWSTARFVFRRFDFDVEPHLRGAVPFDQLPVRRCVRVVWFRVGRGLPRVFRWPRTTMPPTNSRPTEPRVG